MNNTTLIKVSKEEVIQLADKAIEHYKMLQQSQRSQALARLTTERRWFKLLPPYTMQEAIKMVDNISFSFDEPWYERWRYYWFSAIVRLRELKAIAESEVAEAIYVGDKDWNLLEKGKI